MRTLVLCSLIALLAAQSCDNPIAAKTNTTTESDAMTSGVTFNYCTYLEENPDGSCCTTEEIGEVQAKVDALVEWLEGRVAIRDEINAKAFAQINSSLLSANASFHAQLEYEFMPEEAIERQEDRIATLEAQIEALIERSEEARADYRAYLQARKKCYDTIIDIQASAYCLACDPNWEDNGVNADGSITISEATCDRIKENCYDFMTYAEIQSEMAFMVKYAQSLEARAEIIIENLEKFKEIYAEMEAEAESEAELEAALEEIFVSSETEASASAESGNRLLAKLEITLSGNLQAFIDEINAELDLEAGL